MNKKIHPLTTKTIFLLFLFFTSLGMLNAQTGSNDDFDNDGVINSLDLDDDNDGIPDSVESPGCFYTANEWNTSAKPLNKVTITSALTTTTSNFAQLLDGVGDVTAVTFSSTSNIENVNMYLFTFDHPVKLDALYIRFNTASQFNGYTKLQGSNNGTDWVDLSTPAFNNTATVKTHTTSNGNVSVPNSVKYSVSMQEGTAYKYVRITGYNNQGFSAANTNASEVYFDFNNYSYVSSYYPKSTCTDANLDGDGVLPHFDLDSDGDGCSDALEGGATTNTASNYNFPDVDANNDGLVDAVDANNDGIADYVSSYSYYANNAAIKACADTDGDGTLDLTDIDDDNDGVADATESPNCFYTVDEAYIPRRINVGLEAGTDPITNAYDNNTSTTFHFPDGISKANRTVFEIIPVAPMAANAIQITMSSTVSLFPSGVNSLYIDAWNGSSWVTLLPSFNPSDGNNSILGGVQTFTFSQNQAAKYSKFRIQGLTGTVNSSLVQEIKLIPGESYIPSTAPKTTCSNDTDGDLIPNHRDLDSDGDTCSDLAEAGVSPRTDVITPSPTNNTGGSYGMASPTGAQLNPAAADSNNDGLNDSVDTDSNGFTDYKSFYKDYALNSSLKGCLDTDSDGIVDNVDIDDDNDGVPDINEKTCPQDAPYTTNTASGINNMFSLYGVSSPGTLNTQLADDIGLIFGNSWNDTAGITIASPCSQPALEGTGTYGSDIWIKSVNPANITQPVPLYSISFKNDCSSPGAEYLTYTAYDINGLSLYTYNIAAHTAQASNYNFDLVMNPAYDVYGIKITRKANAAILTGVTLKDGNGFTVCNENIDTDNDNVPNRLDRDSDGDGCPDAVESGVSGVLQEGTVYNSGTGSALTQNAVAAGPYGNNGLANGVETPTDSGNVNYTSTYYDYATASAINFCIDSDGDTKKDFADIDDDNDGILDATESPECFYTSPREMIVNVSSKFASSTTDNFNLLYNGTTETSTSSGFNFTTTVPASSNVVGSNIFTLEYVYGIQLSSVEVSHRISSTAGARAQLWGSKDGASWVQLTTSDVNITNNAASTFTVAQNAAKYKYYQIRTTVAGEIPNTYFIGEITGTQASFAPSFYPKSGCIVDNDKDGIPNRLDLDSDGDGCPDAQENAGGYTTLVSSSMAGGNSGSSYTGLSDQPVVLNLGNTVNTNGVPTIAGSGQALGTSQNLRQVALSCQRCNVISGKVINTSSTPIADAAVFMFADFNNDVNNNSKDALLQSTFTDASGNYSFTKDHYLTIADNFSGSVFSGSNNSSGAYNAWLDASWSQSNSSNSGTSSGTNADDQISTQHIYINNGTNVYRKVDLSRISGKVFLSFDYDTEESLDADDQFLVEVSTDGTNFTTVYTYTDNNVTGAPVRNQIVNLSAYAGTPSLTLRFKSVTGSEEFVWLDNIEIFTKYPEILLLTSPKGAYIKSVPEKRSFSPSTSSCTGNDFLWQTTCEVNPLDSDADGLCDALDIDDDNDGVLDRSEGDFCKRLNHEIRVGYLNTTHASAGLAKEMLLNLNNFGSFGTYNKIAGVIFVEFANAADITEANLQAKDIDVFFVGSDNENGSNNPSSSLKAPTSVNNVLASWAKNNNKVVFALQNNAIDYGYTIVDNSINPNAPEGPLGYNTFRNGYWPVTGFSQTGTATFTITSNRTYRTLMVDAGNRPAMIVDSEYNLIIFPDATIYNDEANNSSVDTDPRKVIADAWTFVLDRYLENQCTFWDTDGDNTPNHLDKDSDQDGCNDALEARAISDTSSPANFSFNSHVGTPTDQNRDGLADVVDSDLNGIPDYLSFYKSDALNPSIRACLDSDGDGVADVKDIDDDNDGILDSVEGHYCNGTKDIIKVGFLNTTVGKTGLMQNLLTNPNNFSYTGVYKKVGGIIMVPYANAADITVAKLLEDEIDIFFVGSNASDGFNSTSYSGKVPTSVNNEVLNWADTYNKGVIVVQNNAVDYGFTLTANSENPNVPYGVLGNSIFLNGPWPVSSFSQSGSVRMTAYSSSGSYNVLMIDKKGKATFLSDQNRKIVVLPDATIFADNQNVSTVPTPVNTSSAEAIAVAADVFAYAIDVSLEGDCGGVDTDNDGIFNHLDLDSDGDGCPDTQEAILYNHSSEASTDGNIQNGNNGTVTSTTLTPKARVPGPYGTNGFAVDLQSSSNQDAYKQVYSYKFIADNAEISTCSNKFVLDLDSDDDGVPDAVESPTCFYTETQAMDIKEGVNSAFSWDPANPLSNTYDDNSSSYGAVTPAVNIQNKALITFDLPVIDATYINSIQLNVGSTAFGSGTWRLEGLDINTAQWVELSTAQAMNTANTNVTFTNSLQPAKRFLTYRIWGVSSTNITDNAKLTEIVIHYKNYNPSFHRTKKGCNSDNDNDGVADYLDLDSDGDGCPDAVEAGIDKVLLIPSGFYNTGGIVNGDYVIVGGNYGDNGISNDVETAPDSEILNYISTYNLYANNSAVNFCQDTDKDKVPDPADIDDDNDGVLDAVESPSCFYTAAEANSIFRINSQFSSPTDDQSDRDIQILHDGNSAPVFNFNNYSTAENPTGSNIFTLEYNTQLRLASITISHKISQTTNANAVVVGSQDGFTWSAPLSPSTLITTTPINFSITTSTPYKYYKIQTGTVAGALSTVNTIEEISSVLVADYAPSSHPKPDCSNDTDMDGLKNHHDLDSDGDSCPDAAEAGTAAHAGAGNTSPGDLVNVGGTETGIPNAIVGNNTPSDYGTNGFYTGIESADTPQATYTGTYAYSNAVNAMLALCACYKPAVISGTILDTKHGITALNRAGTEGNNWPMVRKGAWTVLESKTKAFVPNRLTQAQIDAIPAQNLVEGMMVYNIDADCLYINTTGTAAGWKCFKTQGCP